MSTSEIKAISPPRPRTLKIFARCFGFLRPYWKLAVSSYLFFFGTAGLSLLIPQLMRWIIDKGIRTQEIPLVISALFFLCIALVRGVLTFFQGRWTEIVSQGTAFNIRNKIHQKLLSLSFSFHDKAINGEILSRSIQDVERIRLLTGRALQRILEGSILLVGTAIILLSMNPRLALLALASTPFILVIAFSFGRQFRPLSLKIQQQLAVVTSRVEQNLRGMRIVKAFAQEEAEINSFDLENNKWFELSRRAARIRAMNIPVIQTLANIGLAFIIWYGGRLVILGELSLGEMVAFTAYLSQLVLPLRRLGVTIAVLAQAVSAGQRILEILDEKSEVAENPHARELTTIKGDIRFQNVSFSYFHRYSVLSKISFEAKSGQVVAVLGRTGSGKSSLIKLLPRFYDPSEGHIFIDNTDIRDVTLRSLRAQIGIVLQETALFSTSIKENIAFGAPKATEKEIIEAATAAQAHRFITELPEQYDTLVGEQGKTLSGGQKQRIAIARAILCNPRILILDDATASVDTETEWLIQIALENLMFGRTSFIIAQRMSTVRKADMILVLHNGSLFAKGTHKELIKSSGIYADIYNQQLRSLKTMSRPTYSSTPPVEITGAAAGNSEMEEQ